MIAASGTALVHVLDAAGKSLKPLEVGFEAFAVGVIRLAKGDPYDTVLVVGTGKTGGSITALDGDGKALWARTALGFDRVQSMAVCPTRPWAAYCASERRDVTVFDCVDGRTIANTGGRGSGPQTAWATAGDGNTPILLVATVRSLSAFQVKPLPFQSRVRQEPE